MTQTKSYNFDKEYLILNKMSVGYVYSEKPFSYYDSSKQSGKPCPKTKKVPFQRMFPYLALRSLV